MPHSIGLGVNGTLAILPDDREKFVALVSQNVADSKGVEGCIHYAFGAEVRDPNVFHNVEAWTDRLISRDVTACSVSGSSEISTSHEINGRSF